MAALSLIIIGSIAILIGVIFLLIGIVRRSSRLWIWYAVYVAGWMFTITGIVWYALSTAPTSSAQLSSELTTIDASEIVLTTNDFRAGWIRLGSWAVKEEYAQSAYHVSFRKGTEQPSYCYPAVQNMVVVYPSINIAKTMYLGAKPTNISLKYPEIGDECFVNILFPENKLLVFRKSNVVVWVQLKQWEFGDLEPYAKIVEKRISGIESSSKVG